MLRSSWASQQHQLNLTKALEMDVAYKIIEDVFWGPSSLLFKSCSFLNTSRDILAEKH